MATLQQTFSYTRDNGTVSITATVNYSVDNNSDKSKTKITVSSVTVGDYIYTGSTISPSTLGASYLHIYLPAGVDINNVVELSYYRNATTPINVTKTYARGRSDSSQRLGLYIGSPTIPAQNKYVDIQVPAKPSYPVSYNLNGGDGTISPQTKWYNETLTLTTSKPTKTGFTFKGWATSSTGGVVYASGGSYTTNASITLYAVWERNSYAVTYNANGGSGAPANQTKYYAIDLALSNNAPTFSGYTFKGWATSKANANIGSVAYAKGGTYKGNAALNLYAVWELTYQKPTIKNVSVERCLQSGELKDDGECALVTFDWAVFRSSLAQYYGGSNAPYASNSIANDGCVVTVGTYTEYRTPTGASDTSYPVVVGSAFNPSQAYRATISITDNTNHTTTVTGTLPTQYFPMDFNADASAVGFFMPAPDSGSGVYSGKDIHFFVDENLSSGDDGAINQALTGLGWTDVLE